MKIYYMRDNHTFCALPNNWVGIEKGIRYEFSIGQSYGMLCAMIGEKHYEYREHAGSAKELDDFLVRAKEWFYTFMRADKVDQYRDFQKESNKIEGIKGVSDSEIAALRDFVVLDVVTIDDIKAYVKVIQPNAVLRDKKGLNVRVGGYVPLAGGQKIKEGLDAILFCANGANVIPYIIHHQFETLHPFTDGNGRSGRALWLWMMIKRGERRMALELGFLHAWYYQSLANGRKK